MTQELDRNRRQDLRRERARSAGLRERIQAGYERAAGRAVFILLVAVFLVLSLYGTYNHPTGDDYYYAAAPRQAYLRTGSVLSAVCESVRGTAAEYFLWQGTYSAMFLMHLAPNVFGELPYRLVTFLILLGFGLGVFYFLDALLCRALGFGRDGWLLCSSVFCLLAVETNVFRAESFFWYNGSMYYTGYFSVTLCFFGLLLRVLLEGREDASAQEPQGGRTVLAGKKERPHAGMPSGAASGTRSGKRSAMLRMVLLSLLAIFLAGGNYVTLLPSILILATIALLFGWKRDLRWRKVLLLLAILLLGLTVSAAAPGNRIRASEAWGTSAPVAVAKSLRQGIRYLAGWLRWDFLLAAALLMPCFLRAIRSLRARGFRFPLPGLVLAFVYGIFCSMECPTFYAENSPGHARALAVIYYAFLLTALASCFYLLGFLARVLQERDGTAEQGTTGQGAAGQGNPGRQGDRIEKTAGRFPDGEPKPGIGRASLSWDRALPILAALVGLIGILWSGAWSTRSSVIALRELASGNAAAYEAEYRARMEILDDDSVREAVLAPYAARPEMLYVGDFLADPESENNQRYAEYFGKDSLRVDYSGEGESGAAP